MALQQFLQLHSRIHHKHLKFFHIKCKNPELEILLPDVCDYFICLTQISMIIFCNNQLTLC